jgi:hypothetical protein
MIQVLASILVPVGLAWVLALLIVIHFRMRLPFSEAEITETHVDAFAWSGRSRFVVRFRLLRPGIRISTGLIAFILAGEPDKAREGTRCAQLKTYYPVGRRVKAYYLPHFEWLFGYILETPGRPPQTVPLALIALLFAMVVGIVYLKGGYN